MGSAVEAGFHVRGLRLQAEQKRPAEADMQPMQLLSALYAEVAWRRRLWYARRPGLRRRLSCPVVSVGSLSAGGSGKTPLVLYVAALLRDLGERPAILSRGYRRPQALDGVVVARDREGVRATWETTGDEPAMLARALPGIAVLVSPDRYLAGCLAERRLGCTVHLLDDGFQHLALERDVDLLIVRADELANAQVLPAGRLREKLETARVADAVAVSGASLAAASELAGKLGVPRAFAVTRSAGPLQWTDDRVASVQTVVQAFAFAAIARPADFFADLERLGVIVTGTRVFRDHHVYTRADVAALTGQARACGAGCLVTTEKDLVRLLALGPPELPLAWLPLDVSVEPAEEFREWLTRGLAAARRGQAEAAPLDAAASQSG